MAPRPSDKVVLFSPGLDGHRRVYCRVLSDILLRDGMEVCLVTGIPAEGDDEEGAAPESFATGPRFSLIRGPFAAASARGLRSLGALAEAVGAGTIVLTEGDLHLAALASLANPRLRRPRPRLVGMFLRSTNYAHASAGGAKARGAERGAESFVRRVRSRTASARGWRRDPRIFHEVLLPRVRLLDAALYLDETFVLHHPGDALWLPDIYCDFVDAGHEHAEAAAWALKLAEFRERQGERPLFVYVGASDPRRGYDTLLKLAVEEGGCFAHCGELWDPGGFVHDVGALREELAGRGALLETDGYFKSDATAAVFMQAAECVVLPYRNHLGSSGIMLQALAAGVPVLVPDRGLMAERVTRFTVGALYRHGDFDDLRRQYAVLASCGAGSFAAAISGFMEYFTLDQVARALRCAVGTSDRSPLLPHASTHSPAGAADS